MPVRAVACVCAQGFVCGAEGAAHPVHEEGLAAGPPLEECLPAHA